MSSIQKKPQTPSMKYSAGFELNLPRSIRLKVVALQMPQMQKFLKKFSTKINTQQMYYKFNRWLSVYKDWKRQQLHTVQARHEAAVPIQRIVRGFNGRNKFKRCWQQKLQSIVVEEKRKWSMYQLQCFARLCVLKHRAAKSLVIKRANKRGKAATLIQKTFRGFFSRGMTVEVEKRKLIKQLRKWSHGVSNHLINMKELQNGYSQAVLYRAISMSSLSSRPLRNLPRLQDVRTVRRSLFLLYWRLQAHYSGIKDEYRMRQAERRSMYLQDLASQLVEMIALGSIKKLQAEAVALQRQMEREAQEEAHRIAMDQHRMLLDLDSRAAAAARLQKEHDIQRAYKLKLARIAEQQKVLDDLLNEAELMRVEEIVTKSHVAEEKKALAKRLLIREQAKLVEDAKLAGICIYGEEAKFSKTVLASKVQQLMAAAVLPVGIVRRKSKAKLVKPPPAISTVELGIEKYRAQKAEEFATSVHGFRAYLLTLPLARSYIESLCEALNCTQEKVEFPVIPQTAAAVAQKGSGGSAVQKRAISPTKPSPAAGLSLVLASDPNLAAPAVLDQTFLTKQLRHPELSRAFNPVSLLRNLNSTESAVTVNIKGMLSRPQLLQLLGPEVGYGISIAQQQYTMLLQSSLAVDDTAVVKMSFLLKLRKHRQARLAGYNSLVREHAQFKRTLGALHAKRATVHTTKYLTRQERKTALAETAVIEAEVLSRRHKLVELCTSLYYAFHDEVELFLCLFYPVEVMPDDSSNTTEEEQSEGIVSKKVMFGGPSQGSQPSSTRSHYSGYGHLDTTVDKPSSHHQDLHHRHTQLGVAHGSASPSVTAGAAGAAPIASPKAGRRSSRIDAVYIAPKKKEQPSTSAKSMRSKRESILFTGSGVKKAHVVDPYHALHQVPINKTLQHKLAVLKKGAPEVDRTLTYADYWATIQQDMQYYSASPVQIIALPLAPIPTHDNDGKPHILKYGQKGVASKRVNASHVHKHFEANNKGLLSKLKAKEAAIKQQKLMKKEVKLHDIPGFNLFQDSDCEEYDFYLWAEKTILWAKEVSRWFRTQESAWREHNRMHALTYLLRLQWLAEGHFESIGAAHGHAQHTRAYDEAHIKASSMLVRKKLLAEKHRRESLHRYGRSSRVQHALSEEEAQNEKSLFLLRHLDQADILDVFEVLICKSNIGLKVAGAEKKKVFLNRSPTSRGDSSSAKADTGDTNNTNSNTTSNASSEYSRLVTADELDVTVAKHPASLTARFLLIQQALAQEPESARNEQDLLRLSCQNALLFGTPSFLAGTAGSGSGSGHADTEAEAAGDVYLSQGIFHAVHPNIVLLQCLRQELREMGDILRNLTADSSLRIELTPPAVAAPAKEARSQAPGAPSTFIPVTTEDFLVELKYQQIRPIKYVQCSKDYDVWEYHYPSWMYPIVHFGTPAPAESFYRRLQTELRSGKRGKYVRIDATDNSADRAGRVLLRFLRGAVVLRSFIRAKVLAAHRINCDQQMMLWEDSLAAAQRADEEARRIEALRQKLLKRTFVDKLFSCFVPPSLPKRKTRIMHSGHSQKFDSIKASAPEYEPPQGVSACCGFHFQPKYAKVSIFSSDEEFHGVLREALEVPLPVQLYPRRALTVLVKSIMTELLAIETADSFKADGSAQLVSSTASMRDPLTFLQRHPYLGSADEVHSALRAATDAQATVTAATHFRGTSWVTGQVVHLDAQGRHIDADSDKISVEKVSKMSSFYAHLSGIVDKTCTKVVPPVPADAQASALVTTAGVAIAPTAMVPSGRRSIRGSSTGAAAAATKKTAAVVPKIPVREVTKPDRIRLQPEDVLEVSDALEPVRELWLGGGLRNLLVAMRVVEDAQANPRGVAVLNAVLLPPPPPQLHPMSDPAALSDAEGILLMRKKLNAANQQSKKAKFDEPSTKGAGMKRNHGGLSVNKKGVKSADEASQKIAKFIRKRSIRKGQSQKVGAPATPASGGTNTATAGTGAAAAEPSSGAPESAKRQQASVKASTKASSSSGSNKGLSIADQETAKATIGKFLRSKRFNLAVSKSSKKYNYNGTRLRTVAEYRIRTKNETAAGLKIKNFLRNRTAKQQQEEAAAKAAAEKAAAAEAEAELARIAAADREKAENDRAIVCTTIQDLFASARTGFSDRVLCQDRLWQFATHFTIKARNLCAASLKMLKHETPVKPLPSFRNLQHALILAVFRERYKFAVQLVPKKIPNGNAVPAGNGSKGLAANNARSSFTAASGAGPAAVVAPKVRQYVQVLQGFCRIIRAKRVVRERRLQRSVQ